jgi:hypothetical protein
VQIIERSITLDKLSELHWLGNYLYSHDDEIMIRFVVESFRNGKFHCSINAIKGSAGKYPIAFEPKFAYNLNFKDLKNDDKFRVALVIPTGLGASVGGNAGDGGAAARLMASVCDKLITHPNVVNASDINEMTDNTLYVEGYSLSDYLLGNIGLQEIRQNRVLVVVDGSADPVYIDAVINLVNAARVTYGFNCPEVVVLEKPFTMRTGWTSSGRAAGVVDDFETLFNVLLGRKGTYDAVAITSLEQISSEVRDYYYRHGGVNPWGGVEAMLTHAVSHCFKVPCAHAPMMESQEVEQINYGIVDPRCAAETVSLTYLPCILKGLHRAPRIIKSSPDVSCLVIPKRCLGIPMIAAQYRNIPIIAVDDDVEINNIDCTDHIDAFVVSNYMEATGAVTALRSGISFESLCRPISKVKVSRI